MENPRVATHRQHYEAMVDWVKYYLDPLTDEDLKNDIVPGENHGVWVLAHMVVSDDDLSVFLGKGDFLYPKWQELYAMKCPLLPVEKCHPVSELRAAWKAVCEKNRKIYDALTDSELDEPHAQVKGPIEEDYFKTKENILIHWAQHEVYHAGQLGLLAGKLGKAKA